MPEAVQIFIAPPDPAALRERLEGRGTDSEEAIERAAARPPRASSRRSDEFPHVVVNDDLERAADELERIVRARARLSGRAPARPYNAAPMIKPRVDKLLDRTDSHYAAVVVAAKRARQLNSYYRALGEGTYEEYTPPMVETDSGNYLTIALEELAQGKIKYEYRALAPAAAPALGAAAYPGAMARILLGVSGGIAAYKALELARLATQAGHGVRVLMTPDRRSASSAPPRSRGSSARRC